MARELWIFSRDTACKFILSHPTVLEVLLDKELHPYYYSRNVQMFPGGIPLELRNDHSLTFCYVEQFDGDM